MTGSETVESALKDMLPEFLNAEIALRTITDVSMAIEWLKGTFFYIRVRGSGVVSTFFSACRSQEQAQLPQFSNCQLGSTLFGLWHGTVKLPMRGVMARMPNAGEAQP